MPSAYKTRTIFFFALGLALLIHVIFWRLPAGNWGDKENEQTAQAKRDKEAIELAPLKESEDRPVVKTSRAKEDPEASEIVQRVRALSPRTCSPIARGARRRISAIEPAVSTCCAVLPVARTTLGKHPCGRYVAADALARGALEPYTGTHVCRAAIP